MNLVVIAHDVSLVFWSRFITSVGFGFRLRSKECRTVQSTSLSIIIRDERYCRGDVKAWSLIGYGVATAGKNRISSLAVIFVRIVIPKARWLGLLTTLTNTRSKAIQLLTRRPVQNKNQRGSAVAPPLIFNELS